MTLTRKVFFFIVTESCKVDLILVVDESTRMTMYESSVKFFLTRLIHEVNVGDTQTHVSLGLFTSLAHEQFDLDAHTTTDSLSSAINHIRFRGGLGDVDAGISYAVDVAMTSSAADRPNVDNVVIFITADNAHSFGHLRTLEHEIHAKSDNVILIDVGLARVPNLATDTGHELRWQANDLESQKSVEEVAKLVCEY